MSLLPKELYVAYEIYPGLGHIASRTGPDSCIVCGVLIVLQDMYECIEYEKVKKLCFDKEKLPSILDVFFVHGA